MSFFKVGDKFGVNQANLMKKIGYGDSSDPGTNEVRLFNESGTFVFKVWNGSTWDVIGTADKLKYNGSDKVIAQSGGARVEGTLNVVGPAYVDEYLAVDGSTSYGYISFRKQDGTNGATLGTGNGSDVMKLNLQDANMLHVQGGDIAIDQCINAAGAYGFILDKTKPGKKFRIEIGEFAHGAGGSGDLNHTETFQAAFTSVPRVLLQDWMLYDWSKSVFPKSRTTTGFIISYDLSKNQNVDWLAIGEK